MASISFPILLRAFVSLISISSLLSSHAAKNNLSGFSTTLINPHSMESPFYNPKLTYANRVNDAVKQSLNRNNYFQSKTSQQQISPDFQTWSTPDRAAGYVVSFYIGTPPVQTYALLDTGSHLVWLQCSPCELCYSQRIPIFNPHDSATYQELNCMDYRCRKVPFTKCGKKFNLCKYGIQYGDSAYSSGEVASETLTFTSFDDDDSDAAQQNITFTQTIIGCGRNNSVAFASFNIPGVMGLDRADDSFIYQIGYNYFAYCFTPWLSDRNSFIHFERSSDVYVYGDSTPMLSSYTGFYYLYLKGISVGSVRLPIPAGTFNITKGGGGFIIDSGSTFTTLHMTGFSILVQHLQDLFAEVVEDPYDSKLFKFCYREDNVHIIPPIITFHLHGVDLKLELSATWFYRRSRIYCLAMLPATDVSIFGYTQQQNYFIAYDFIKETISFQKRDCTRQSS